MADILVAGSLHLDVMVTAPHLPRLDQTVAGQGVSYVFGGKGGNQALAAARMGAQVAMAGAVGSDGFAETILAALDAGGVRRTRVRHVQGPSGMSVAIVDASGGYGAVIVSAANLMIDAETPFPPGCRMLILQNEVPEAANLRLATRARTAGLRVILNAAPARVLSADMLPLVDLLVVNRGEAADLLGQVEADLDPARAAQALCALGPHAVIVTLGAYGLAGSGPDGPFAQAAPAATVISTHGAGDAFIGAMAAEWLHGTPLPQAARFGQTAAALHVSTPPDRRAAITEAMVRARLSLG